MGNTLVLLLADLTDGHEFRVRPLNGEWEAMVTRYGRAGLPNREFRATGASSNIALQAVLLQIRQEP